LFGGTSKEKLLGEIETFYSKEEQNKYGVVGIKIEVVK
jgi:ASC-1-like (ASCH) protein